MGRRCAHITLPGCQPPEGEPRISAWGISSHICCATTGDESQLLTSYRPSKRIQRCLAARRFCRVAKRALWPPRRFKLSLIKRHWIASLGMIMSSASCSVRAPSKVSSRQLIIPLSNPGLVNKHSGKCGYRSSASPSTYMRTGCRRPGVNTYR